MRSKKIFIILFLTLSVIVVFYLDHEIKEFNPSFYAGKVGGDYTRFLTIIILSTMFYIINDIKSKHKLVRYIYSGITGFIVGLVLGIICHVVMWTDYEIIYQFITITLCYFSYFILRKTVVKIKSK